MYTFELVVFISCNLWKGLWTSKYLHPYYLCKFQFDILEKGKDLNLIYKISKVKVYLPNEKVPFHWSKT